MKVFRRVLTFSVDRRETMSEWYKLLNTPSVAATKKSPPLKATCVTCELYGLQASKGIIVECVGK